jgi:hypothetical protein
MQGSCKICRFRQNQAEPHTKEEFDRYEYDNHPTT